MRRLPALVPWSATSRSRAAPCCSGSSSPSSSLWPSWRAAEGDVAGASGGWVVAGAVVAGAGGGAGGGGGGGGGAGSVGVGGGGGFFVGGRGGGAPMVFRPARGAVSLA